MDPSIRHSLTSFPLLSAAENINKPPSVRERVAADLSVFSGRDPDLRLPPKKNFLASRPPDGRRRKKGGMPICGGRNASRPPLFYTLEREAWTHMPVSFIGFFRRESNALLRALEARQEGKGKEAEKVAAVMK